MSIESLKQQARRHEQNEEWQKALDQYLKAIQELARDDQTDIGLHNRVGDLYVRLGKLDRAVEHYEKAVDLYREAYLPNNAIAVCKKIIRNVPNRHQAYLKIGQIRAEQGFLPDARTNFLTYAERMQQAGNLDESFRALVEFCDLAPDDVDVRITVADQMAANGRKAEAVQQLVVAYGHLSRAGEADAAAGVAKKLHALDPEVDLEEALAATSQASAGTGYGEVELEVQPFELVGRDEPETPSRAASGRFTDDDDGREWTPEAEAEAAAAAAAALPLMSFGGDDDAPGAEEDDEADAGATDLPLMRFDDDAEEAAPELPTFELEEAGEEEATPLPTLDFGGESELAFSGPPADEPPAKRARDAGESALEETASERRAAERAPEPAQKAGGGDDGYVDFGAMVLGGGRDPKTTRFKVAYEEPTGDEEADFAKMLSQFKEKVSENIDAGDVRAHYDLGTAYKEMGLLEEAISAFQSALRASADHLPTYELMGQTFIEMGKPEAAVNTLQRALQVRSGVEDEYVGIYYYLARAYEALNKKDSALEFYDRVFALDINFADVTDRLRELR